MSRAPLASTQTQEACWESWQTLFPEIRCSLGICQNQPLSSVYRTRQLCFSRLVSRSATVASSTGAT